MNVLVPPPQRLSRNDNPSIKVWNHQYYAPLCLCLFAFLVTLYNASQIPNKLLRQGTTHRRHTNNVTTPDELKFHEALAEIVFVEEEEESNLAPWEEETKTIIIHNSSNVQPVETTMTTTMTTTTTTGLFRSKSLMYNSSQLLAWLDGNETTSTSNSKWTDTKMILQRMPAPQHEDIEIYNMAAWHKLRHVLGLETPIDSLQPPDDIVTICLTGGSISANAKIRPNDRFDIRFVEMLNVTHSEIVDVQRLQLVNRGHGQRDSSHTAFLMHTYVPANTTILLWEFSVNDSNQESCTKINNMFLTYLNQVAFQFQENPPLVILVYMWDKWKVTSNRSVTGMNSTVFRCHDRLAAAYDFVVGSIYLGSYLRHLDWHPMTAGRLFAADLAHPNKLGHDIVAFLLWDLVVNNNRQAIEIKNQSNVAGEATMKPVLRKCNKKNDARMMKLKTLQEQSHAFASWTAEVPKNSDHNPGMIYPKMISATSPRTKVKTELKRWTYGKADTSRLDRKDALVLPCCHSKRRLSFDLSHFSNATTANHGGYVKVSALQIFLGKPFSPQTLLQVDMAVNDGGHAARLTSRSNNRSVWVHPWRPNEKCLIAYFTRSSWMVLQEPIPTNRIDFCDQSPTCSSSERDSTKTETLAHLVLF